MMSVELSVVPASVRALSRGSRELSRFYRRGWLPLVVGTFALSVIAILVWDLFARARGVAVPSELRTMVGLQAFILSAVVAAWSGVFVHRTRVRIERERESLLHERAALAEQRRRLEQIEGVAAVLRVMAHEIRNPLNSVRLHANVARRALRRGAVQPVYDSLDALDAETIRLASLVDEYLELGNAEPTSLRARRIDLRAAVRGAVEVHRQHLEAAGIAVNLDLDDGELPIDADGKKIADIVHKLLRNASEALDKGGGAITVRVRREDRSVPMASVEVSDSGPGFADPSVAFRPFYSTKPLGTGLGLSIVHDLVRAHRGEVCALNRHEGGACVLVRLPLCEVPCPE